MSRINQTFKVASRLSARQSISLILTVLALGLLTAACMPATPAPAAVPTVAVAPTKAAAPTTAPTSAPAPTAAPTTAPTSVPATKAPPAATQAPAATAANQTVPTAPPPTAAAKTVSFAKDVLPIFEQSCVKCHGGTSTEQGLALKTYAQVMKGSDNGEVIKPGDAKNSFLVQQINNGKMPKRASKLPQAQLDIIAAWVNAGALNN